MSEGSTLARSTSASLVRALMAALRAKSRSWAAATTGAPGTLDRYTSAKPRSRANSAQVSSMRRTPTGHADVRTGEVVTRNGQVETFTFMVMVGCPITLTTVARSLYGGEGSRLTAKNRELLTHPHCFKQAGR